MMATFFKQLEIPAPDIDLGVGSGSHAWQTAEIMKRFEPLIDQYEPAAVLVVGDVNSTVACALVAVKLGVPVIHVEAGLRSFDRAMPEEVNRVLTDQISDLLFTTEPEAADNLEREGISRERVHFVGNVMIDSLLHSLPRAVPPADTLAGRLTAVVDKVNLEECGYVVATLHRPANVDDPETLRRLLETLVRITDDVPVVFPAHPRTRGRIAAQPQLEAILSDGSIYLTEPLGYLEILGLVANATAVLTDSGGLQEETTALGVPCLTLRPSTERPITVTEGTNTVTGTDPSRILGAWRDIVENGGKRGRRPALWDGHAAERIVGVMQEWLG